MGSLSTHDKMSILGQHFAGNHKTDGSMHTQTIPFCLDFRLFSDRLLVISVSFSDRLLVIAEPLWSRGYNWWTEVRLLLDSILAHILLHLPLSLLTSAHHPLPPAPFNASSEIRLILPPVYDLNCVRISVAHAQDLHGLRVSCPKDSQGKPYGKWCDFPVNFPINSPIFLELCSIEMP